MKKGTPIKLLSVFLFTVIVQMIIIFKTDDVTITNDDQKMSKVVEFEDTPEVTTLVLQKQDK
ncbi:hypothetical protein [Aquimarina agarivorans]|uniref:hypothetical protein n=1 Tax=Aquimarina agarivorans TaxID=980584 RepID=UPI000248E80E|nr:hypothetical protein [Aquimarina agarivorans]